MCLYACISLRSVSENNLGAEGAKAFVEMLATNTSLLSIECVPRQLPSHAAH